MRRGVQPTLVSWLVVFERWTNFEVFARHLIDESIKTFTTGLDYNNPNHTLQHTPSDGSKYIGQPSPEIDAAWEEIAGSRSPYHV
jgi:hypothetical protein